MLAAVTCFATLLPYDGVGMTRIVHSTQSPNVNLGAVYHMCTPAQGPSWPNVRSHGSGSAGVRDSQCVCVCVHTQYNAVATTNATTHSAQPLSQPCTQPQRKQRRNTTPPQRRNTTTP